MALVPSGLLAAPAPIVELRLDGPIGPAGADYVLRGLARAQEQGAQLLILNMDTPGGLDTSMRAIIKAILASPVPVASYVAPSGARAASAGTYILYASHIAAMAPGTNLGAATPVAIGMPGAPSGKPAGEEAKPDEEGGQETPADAMSAKQINDASAYIRGLAQLRGRNVEWAEQAVRQAHSLSAEEALQRKVVDYLASDLADLLLVDAGHDDFGRLRNSDGDANRRLIDDVVAEAECQLQVLALKRRAVTNAVDFELALVTVLNTLQDVFDHRAGHAPLRTSILGVVDRLYDNSVVFELHGDFVICDEEKFTLRALDGDLLAFDRGGHTSRNRNGLLTDTRHSFSCLFAMEIPCPS